MRLRPWQAVIIAVLLCTLQMGAVRRRLTIRSNPPGAQVYIDDQYIGVTPVSTSFVYYGTRKVQLVKSGFETVTEKHKIAAPWYQYPVIDFFAENVNPQEIRDEREIRFQLEPQQLIAPEELLRRGKELRGSVQQSYVAPVLPPARAPFQPQPAVQPPAAPGQPPFAPRQPLFNGP